MWVPLHTQTLAFGRGVDDPPVASFTYRGSELRGSSIVRLTVFGERLGF